MISFQAKVIVSGGLHARPAAVFVNHANRFSSSITVEKNGKQANGKSLLHVMSLGAREGDEITLHIEGNDEQSAAEELSALFENNFAV